jgi:serine/threonine protein phosphatase PrpC
MPSQPFAKDTYSLSHVGNVRQLNEDRFFSNPDAGVWAVADGMGGHHAGDFASQAIVDGLATIPVADSPAVLEASFRDSVERANRAIRAFARLEGNMVVGSTLVCLLTFVDIFRCFWAGDSRIYLLRDNKLRQLSQDHTEVQSLLDEGLLSPEEAASYPRRNVITHAIGIADQVYLDHADGEIRPRDSFLLCSDGLTGHVSDEEIAAIMNVGTAEEICHELVSLALFRGGSDNVTVNIVQFHPASSTMPAIGLSSYAGSQEGGS